MKTFKISCRKVKISISSRGGNFQFSARGESYVYLTSPTCNMPLRETFSENHFHFDFIYLVLRHPLGLLRLNR